MFGALIHRYIYLAGLSGLAVGLCFSNALMSIGQIVLICNWAIEGDFKQKWDAIKSSKILWAFGIIYLVHLVGLLHTSNFEYALKDLRIKLPILVIPLVFVSGIKLTKKELYWLLGCLISSFFVISFYGLTKYLGWFGQSLADLREISPWISLVRFSFGVLFILLFLVDGFKSHPKWRIVIAGLVGYFALWLVIGQAITALLLGALVLLLILIAKATVKVRIAAVVVSIALLSTAVHFVTDNFVPMQSFEEGKLIKSDKGDLYYHDPSHGVLENGHFVYQNILWSELREGWEERSSVSFIQEDLYVKPRLIRYLTSKGLVKNKANVMSLSDEEIIAIEQGVTNERFLGGRNVFDRLYESCWEVHVYLEGMNPSGNSLGQRFEFWRTGLIIWSDNFWFGVGTGDIADAFNDYYVIINSPLDEQARDRSHNQWLSIGLTFGLFGFLIVAAATVVLVRENRAFGPKFFLISVLLLMSFLTEDTLETQAGVTLFCCFTALPGLLNRSEYRL